MRNRSAFLWAPLLGALGLVLAPGAGAEAPAGGDAAAAAADADAARRVVLVPYEELDLLLREGTRRVLLDRAEFLALLARARRTAGEQPPSPAVFTGARYHIEMGDDLARIEGTLDVELLGAGLQALPFPARGLYLEQVSIGDLGAPIGQGEDGRLTLLLEGPGPRRMTVRASVPIQTDAARQTLSFALPMPAPARLSLSARGDVDVSGGADVLRRVYDAEADTTRFDLLPPAGELSLVLTLNNKRRRQERSVAVRSVLVSEITPSHEFLTARFSMDVKHRAADAFRFRLPEGFEVAEVGSTQLSEWRVEEGGAGRTLVVTLREETLNVVPVSISAFRAGPPRERWTLSAFEPLEATSHVSVLGVMLDTRLQLAASVPERLVPVDLSVLTQALSGRAADPGRRPVLAFFAPAPGHALEATFTQPDTRLDIVSNLRLLLRDDGLEARGGFVLTPSGEACAEFAFRMPPDWRLESVSDDQGRPMPYEIFSADDAVRVVLPFREAVPSGVERGVAIVARHVPAGWLEAWSERAMEYPRFSVESATREVGAIAIDAGDDIEARAVVVEGLVPLDETEKTRFGLAGVAASLAYRYDHPGYRAGMVLTRSAPRLNAETFSFFQLGADVIQARYEFLYYLERARAREVTLWLPAAVPATLSIRGVGGTEVKEYTAEAQSDGTRWTVTLAEAAAETIHLAVDTQVPRADPGEEAVRLPLPKALNVAYQSGFIAVEGSAELDIQMLRHPRLVDVGELIEAEYRPGRRLLGAYAFTGDHAEIEARVTRRTHHALPAALGTRGRLQTVLSADRVWQSRAEFTLQARSGFLQVDLPAGAELWSAVVNGQPARPQRIGEGLVLDLPAAGGTETRLELVYAGVLDAWGFLGTAALQAPALRLLQREAGASEDVPCADFEWTLIVPPGFAVASSGGTMEQVNRTPPPVAAVQMGKGLYYAAGTINPGVGLLSGMLVAMQSASQRARMASRGAYKEAHYEEGGQVAIYDMEQGDALESRGPPAETAWGGAPPAPSRPPMASAPSAPPPGKLRVEGMRSLEIALAATGDAVHFRGLGEQPELRVTVIHRRRHAALATGVALGVLLGGLLLVGRSRLARARYLALVLAVSALLPALPALLIWTPVFNAAFYAACGLIPLYLCAALLRRAQPVWTRWTHGLYSRLVPLLLVALVLGPRAHGAADDRRPVTVPDDVVVAPYTADPRAEPRQVLIPYGLFEQLMRPDAAVVGPAEATRGYALAGSQLTARLGNHDRLELEGWIDLEVFGDDPVSVPLPLRGAVIAQARIQGEPARLTLPDVAPARPDSGKAQRSAPAPVPAPFAPAPTLLLHGRGRYRVELVLQAQVARDGGWRRVGVVLPVAPANVLVLETPGDATELRLGGGAQRLTFTTDAERPRRTFALPASGQLDLQWRPKAGEGQADRSLFAESTGVLDVLEDRLDLLWRVNFQFRHGEVDRFVLRPPEGFEVESVEGPNVRGWEVGAEDALLRVELLNPARGSEVLTVRLRRPDWRVLDEAHEMAFPVLRAPDAIRETGRLVLRRSPRLEVRAEAREGVRRIDPLAAPELDRLGLQAAETAFGIDVFQSFEYTALPVQIQVQASPRATSLRAEVQALLRVAELERRLEGRVVLEVKGAPVHRATIQLPRELDVREVASEIPIEWAVAPAGDHQVLTVFFSRGVEGRMPITLTGRLGELGAARQIPLPQIEVRDAVEQEGALAILTDPGFDVRAGELQGLEMVLLQRLHAWLGESQRAMTRLALAWRRPGYGGWVEPVAIAPDVLASTLTAVRVTDRAVEETTLIDLEIRNSGVRRVAFALPAELADATIRVPLLRERTLQPLPDSDEVLVTLTLQDEVMQQLRILITSARLISDGEQTVRLPRLVDLPVTRRLVVLESAGRDEVEVTATQGLDPLGRQQRDWALLAPVLRGGQADAYSAPAGVAAPTLRFRPRPRDTVQTAGAGIGLARTDLFVDANGAYRMRQVYHVNNRTEQFLDLRLPAGARLWAVSVAGEPVKPVVSGEDGGVRIPLVKTASGDLDYPVELMLGGRMDPPRAGRSVDFPLIRTVNIACEQSQVELRLPRTHRWFAFDGTLRRLEDGDQLVAGEIAYQTGLAKRLVQTLESGNPFEQARARSNLANLKMNVSDYSNQYASAPSSSALRQELSEAEAVISAGERKAEAAAAPEAELDATLLIERSYTEQRNFYNRNAVLSLEDNWGRQKDVRDVDGPGVGEVAVDPVSPPAAFNAQWFKDDLVQEGRELKTGEEPPTPQTPSRRGIDQQSFWEGNVREDANQPLIIRGQLAGRSRGQAEATQRYAQELQESQSVAGPEQAGEDRAGSPVVGRVSGQAADTGLASLALPFLAEDPGRWTTYRFATPRGEVALSARSISQRSVEGLQRLAAGLLALIVLPLILRRLAGGAASPKRRRTVGTLLIVAASFGLLFGIFPLAALVLLVTGIVMKIRTPRPVVAG
jgi:hypothetical protein